MPDAADVINAAFPGISAKRAHATGLKLIQLAPEGHLTPFQ
jgi:hypothetical protein